MLAKLVQHWILVVNDVITTYTLQQKVEMLGELNKLLAQLVLIGIKLRITFEYDELMHVVLSELDFLWYFPLSVFLLCITVYGRWKVQIQC